MKNVITKINVSVLCLFTALSLYAAPARAFIKFDVTGPVADILDKIKQEAIKYEEVYKSQLEKLNQKVLKATGGEGAALFKAITDDASAIVTSAAKGQYNAGDFGSSNLMNTLRSQLGNYKLDYATLYNQVDDYVKAQERAKMDKKLAMETELVKLKSQRAALDELIAQNPNDGDTAERQAQLDALDQAIAALQLQIKQNNEQQVIEDEQATKLEEQMKGLQDQINGLTAQASADNLMNQLKLQASGLFGHEDGIDDDNTEELYETALSRLFLEENEMENPENVARIMKIRKKEYYDALKNSLETVVTTYGSIVEISERSKTCSEASTKMANGVFGEAAMQICMELQNTKIAARYMEILLALIRFETTLEMQTWTNKYKLKDYEKDVTKFNLDDYVLKKENLLKKLRNRANSAIDDKINDLVGF